MEGPGPQTLTKMVIFGGSQGQNRVRKKWGLALASGNRGGGCLSQSRACLGSEPSVFLSSRSFLQAVIKAAPLRLAPQELCI